MGCILYTPPGPRGREAADGCEMVIMARCVVVLAILAGSTGCAVIQNQSTPVEARRLTEPATGRDYWLYVPSYYAPDRSWPLVVTLHGSGLWDSSEDQIREWKHLAEKRGLIVAAPDLHSASFCRIGRGGWLEDLRDDERAVLAVIDHLVSTYSIAPMAAGGAAAGTGPVRRYILLTGFLEGGYPLYYIGLRHAGLFSALVARDCYTDTDVLEDITISAEARKTPMLIASGKDGWWTISGCLWYQGEAWKAYRFLRSSKCYLAKRKEHNGGQLRRPLRAYQYWMRFLPKALRR